MVENSRLFREIVSWYDRRLFGSNFCLHRFDRMNDSGFVVVARLVSQHRHGGTLRRRKSKREITTVTTAVQAVWRKRNARAAPDVRVDLSVDQNQTVGPVRRTRLSVGQGVDDGSVVLEALPYPDALPLGDPAVADSDGAGRSQLLQHGEGLGFHVFDLLLLAGTSHLGVQLFDVGDRRGHLGIVEQRVLLLGHSLGSDGRTLVLFVDFLVFAIFRWLLLFFPLLFLDVFLDRILCRDRSREFDVVGVELFVVEIKVRRQRDDTETSNKSLTTVEHLRSTAELT